MAKKTGQPSVKREPRWKKGLDYVYSPEWMQTSRSADIASAIFVLNEVIPLAVGGELIERGTVCYFNKGKLNGLLVPEDNVFITIWVEQVGSHDVIAVRAEFSKRDGFLFTMQIAHVRTEFEPKEIVREIVNCYMRLRTQGFKQV